MFFLRIKSPYRWFSALWNAWNWACDMGVRSAPMAPRRVWVSGMATTLLISALSRSTTTLGVLAGAYTPYQALISTPLTPASALLGTSGNWAIRLVAAIASDVLGAARTAGGVVELTRLAFGNFHQVGHGGHAQAGVYYKHVRHGDHK